MLRELVRSRRRAQRRNDDGVALVAAIATAIIGVALTTLVVSQVIVVTNDAARDRVRTSEIHSAEGALDAALREMETGLVCTPSFSPLTVGEGTSEVEATVTVVYYDGIEGNPPLPCAGNLAVGDAVQAVVTATATPTNPAPGVAPQRTIQAEVRIRPNKGLSVGSSIFADSNMNVQNSATIEKSAAGDPANVWLDSGDFSCNNSLRVEGDVIVVDGSITMSNSCSIEGQAWALTGMTVSTSVNGWRVAGDVTVAQGSFSNSNNSKYGGNLSAFGSVSGDPDVAGSICSDGACPSFELYEPREFPQVFYVPGDWAPDFDEKQLGGPTAGVDTFAADMIEAGAFKNTSSTNEFLANPCEVKKQWLKNGAIELNKTETKGSLYNLTGCDVVWEGLNLKIYQDTAFFVGSFRESNGMSITSGDGDPHKVWFIVPFNSTGNNNISLTNQVSIPAPVSVFYYTPGTVQANNNQKLHGQIYGKTVNLTNNFTLTYDPMGIPNVDLGGGTSIVNSGYSIEIEKKRELRQ